MKPGDPWGLKQTPVVNTFSLQSSGKEKKKKWVNSVIWWDPSLHIGCGLCTHFTRSIVSFQHKMPHLFRLIKNSKSQWKALVDGLVFFFGLLFSTFYFPMWTELVFAGKMNIVSIPNWTFFSSVSSLKFKSLGFSRFSFISVLLWYVYKGFVFN